MLIAELHDSMCRCSVALSCIVVLSRNVCVAELQWFRVLFLVVVGVARGHLCVGVFGVYGLRKTLAFQVTAEQPTSRHKIAGS